jgi:hypothetical protein
VCSNAIDSACGDPFNANSINASEKVEAGPGQVCVVRLHKNKLVVDVVSE